MAKKNVVRQDIVQILFDSNINELTKIQKQVNDLRKNLGGGVGEDALEDLKKAANGASDGLEDVEEKGKKAGKSLENIEKKGSKAYAALKKIAGVSFKALGVGLAASATGVTAIVKESVQSFAEYEQLVGGVETLLGAKGAKSVEEYAKITGKSVDKVKGEFKSLMESEKLVLDNARGAYKSAGLTQNQYMETVTGFSASLLQSVGGDTVKAANLAHTAVTDMSDNANKMGTSMELIQNAYGGFAKSNWTMLDNLKLGYGGTKEEMKRLIKDAAKIDKSVDANSMSYGNVVKAIHAVQENLGILGTTQKEAEKTITGSMSSMKGAWGNLLTAMGSGEDLEPYIKNVVDTVTIFGRNLMPVIGKSLSGIGTVIEELAPVIAEQLPGIVKDLLPPLIKAAGTLITSLVKELPAIIQSLMPAIKEAGALIVKGLYEVFTGKQMSDDAFGNVTASLGKILDTVKKMLPVILGLVAAFKLFKGAKFVSSLFGGKSSGEGGEKGSNGIFGGLTKMFEDLAKLKPTTILKGMANIAIILGGFTAITAVLMLIAPQIAKIGGYTELLKLVGVIAVVGIVGTALAKMAGEIGDINIMTCLKGLANMGIALGSFAIAYMIVGAISLIPFDIGKILKVVGVIGAMGAVAAALALCAGLLGMIPILVLLLGMANMGIALGSFAIAYMILGAVSLIPFDMDRIKQVVKMIALMGAVAAGLALFAGIVGAVPIPVVIAGLANMGLVLGGVTALIVAFGKLSESKGFTEFISKGGELLKKVFTIIGEIGGSLIAGFGEAMSKSLPTIGENIGKFGENIKPLFDAIKGVDMGGLGEFFNSIVTLLGVATGNEIVEGIKSLFGGDDESSFAKLGTNLCDFAENAKGFFDVIKEIPEESFTKAAKLFESFGSTSKIGKESLLAKVSNGSISLATVGTELSSFGSKTEGFFAQLENMNLDKLNSLWESLKTADDVTASSLKAVNDNITDIVSKVSELPKKMGDGLKSAGESLSTALVEVWKDAVEASVEPVNKLLDAANHILGEFGSDKKVISWEPYARGTKGHKGGNALVNDGTGAELIQMPNGNMFIPRGRNVFLPNAPKGMKVLPANKTARLMGRNSASFRYADGVGDLDVWSYYDNASGLVSKISDSISYKGMSGLALNIGKGMVTTFTGQMEKWIEKLFDEYGGKSLESYVASKGVGQWRSTVAQALKMEGQYSAANVARTLFQMQTESGGNPRAINLWDSNAKKGIPSKGLMQVIDPTFKAYARAGFNKNIYDPLSNILASIRYATSRYGSLAKAYRGVGYSKGVGTITTPKQPVNVTYTPENDSAYYSTSSVEHNTYAPQFTLNISGSNDDKVLARKVKRWIAEAMDETFSSLERKNPKLVEV